MPMQRSLARWVLLVLVWIVGVVIWVLYIVAIAWLLLYVL
jgi:hypothetical protein